MESELELEFTLESEVEFAFEFEYRREQTWKRNPARAIHFISETREGFRCRANAQALDDWAHTLETTSRDGTKGAASSQAVDGAVLSRSVVPG